MSARDREPATSAGLVETFVSSEEVFKGKLLHVVRDTVTLPNGHSATR